MRRYYWQKARILWDDKFPYLEGLFVWTRNEHPALWYLCDDFGKHSVLPSLTVLTNLEPNRWSEAVGLDPYQIERYLEFAVTVGTVKRRVWTNRKWKGARPPKGFRKEDESNLPRPHTARFEQRSSRSITDVVKSAVGRTT